MKLAVTYDNGNVFGHFGHTEAFRIYDIDGDKITSVQTVPTNGTGHGALAGFLAERGAEALICGGIGGGALAALSEAGIAVYPGVTGNADEAARAFADGKLTFDPTAHCDHHDHAGHSEHSCGAHGCGHGNHGCKKS